MAPEVASDPTVAQLMFAGSAVRFLAHHLSGFSVTVALDILTGVPGPGVAILLHGQTNAEGITRLADSLGLPSPVVVPGTVGGDTHYETTGTWRSYQVRVAAIVYAWAKDEVTA